MLRGVAVSATTLRRSDLERLENTVGACRGDLGERRLRSCWARMRGCLTGTAAKRQVAVGDRPLCCTWSCLTRPGPDKGRRRPAIRRALRVEQEPRDFGQRDPKRAGRTSLVGRSFDNPNDYVNVRTDGAYFRARRDAEPAAPDAWRYYGRRDARYVYSRVSLGLSGMDAWRASRPRCCGSRSAAAWRWAPRSTTPRCGTAIWASSSTNTTIRSRQGASVGLLRLWQGLPRAAGCRALPGGRLGGDLCA